MNQLSAGDANLAGNRVILKSKKPHIRMLLGHWYCYLRPTEPIAIGRGHTPIAAYRDWRRANGLVRVWHLSQQ